MGDIVTMEDKNKSPVLRIMEKRLECITTILDEWKKLDEYMMPFADENMKKIIEDIKTKLIILPIEDMLLVTAMQAENKAFELLRPKKLFCLKCGVELDENKPAPT